MLCVQDVLRNWHSREAKIIQTMTTLVANAEKAADAFRNGKIMSCDNLKLYWCLGEGDLTTIGDCLNKYRDQKLIMAPGKATA